MKTSVIHIVLLISLLWHALKADSLLASWQIESRTALNLQSSIEDGLIIDSESLSDVRAIEIVGNWQQVATLVDSSGFQDRFLLIGSPNIRSDKTLFVTTRGDLFRSVDGGQTWTSTIQRYYLSDPIFSPDYATDNTIFLTCRTSAHRFVFSRIFQR